MPEEALRETSELNQTQGLNLDSSLLSLQPSQCIIADNVDRDTSYALRQRQGCVLDCQLETRIVGIYNHEWVNPGGEESGVEGEHVVLLATDEGRLFMRTSDGSCTEVPGGDAFVGEVSGATYASFVTVAGDTYITFGQGRLRVFDGSYQYAAGQPQPTVRPTGALAGAGAGNLDEDHYRLHYSYIFRTPGGRVIEGQRSSRNLSPVLVSDNTTDGQINWTLTAPPAGSPYRFTGYRLYRTFGHEATGDNKIDDPAYFFLADVDYNGSATQVYLDNVADFELGEAEPGVGDFLLPPEGAGPLNIYGHCLFINGSLDNPHRQFYSALGNYEAFPTTFYNDFETSSTSKLHGGVVHRNILTTFTDDEIWHTTGASPDTFVVERQTENLGCVAPGAVQQVGGFVVFVSRNGVYGWDGNTPTYLSGEIEEYLRDIPLPQLRQTYTATYRKLGHVYFSIEDYTGVRRVFVYDYEPQTTADRERAAQIEGSSRAWFRYTGAPMAATAMGRVSEFTSRVERIWLGGADGKVYRYDEGWDDAGVPIDTHVRFLVAPHQKGSDYASSRALDATWRHWVLFIDRWEGALTVGWGFWDSHLTTEEQPLWRTFGPVTHTGRESRKLRVNLDGRGTGALVADVRYQGGEFRVIGHSFWWRPNRRGLHGYQV